MTPVVSRVVLCSESADADADPSGSRFACRLTPGVNCERARVSRVSLDKIYFEIDQNNGTIDFDDGAVATAQIPAGTYATPAALAAAVAAAMNLVGGAGVPFAAACAPFTNIMTITGAAVFTLLFVTGPTAATSARSMLGYALQDYGAAVAQAAANPVRLSRVREIVICSPTAQPFSRVGGSETRAIASVPAAGTPFGGVIEFEPEAGAWFNLFGPVDSVIIEVRDQTGAPLNLNGGRATVELVAE